MSEMENELDERVLAWVKRNARGREYACCRVRDLQAPRADVFMYPCFLEEQIPAVKADLVVASQGQCAYELDVPVEQVRASVARLVQTRIADHAMGTRPPLGNEA